MPTTHADFSAFMGARSTGLLTPLNAALTRGVLPESEVEGECYDNQSNSAYAGEIAWNDLFFNVPVNPYQGDDDSATADDPFPKASGVITDLTNLSKGDQSSLGARDTLMPYVMQYNLLEAYRKGHLSRKQRRQQLIQHAQFMSSQYGLTSEEINRLVLLEKLGQTGVGTAT